MIKWFKNIHSKLYERYLCYYLYIDYHRSIIRIYSDKNYKFRIEIPYVEFENKIVFKEYLNMYLILHGFALRLSDKTIYKRLNDKDLCVMFLEKLG
jgi:CRISPR/Cas system CMR-associated protein Cmr1 (group 7 of RAMP superfamily)